MIWREEWPKFVQMVENSGMPPGRIAKQLGISRPGLLKILKGETKEPYKRTRDRIYKWMNRHSDTKLTVLQEAVAEQESPEAELLDYFLQHHEQMATFMTTSTQGLDAEERRLVALAILQGFKRLAIEQGEPVPDEIFELERRFVGQ